MRMYSIWKQIFKYPVLILAIVVHMAIEYLYGRSEEEKKCEYNNNMAYIPIRCFMFIVVLYF